ncbi:Nif3-like dinuclear metal center hexameric protein [Desulfosporosinus sp. BG]|uniref:Nif3-like dinuclear metal center hexameric protein n=1 Tax=Desulfosporosinus sp. BG TaxID=1633135 RepID=UPI000857F0D7|nr:Nif3-like dinuclear metal center hexameric protein [Desulfosporosinus sp. BG]ODA40863.1 hypothetical protein DSBG_2304 [Desulfosporosinus sp. BG]
MNSDNITNRDLLTALNTISGGRVPLSLAEMFSGENPFVVIKSSNIPGKAVMETPGLVFGQIDQPVRKLAVLMTLTESAIELAAATGVDAIVAHHPIADAANSGGVTLKNYLGLYRISAFELHEAFHGLHPGLAILHGHTAFKTEIAYGGIPGNIMYVGQALPEVRCLEDILLRLETLMGMDEDRKMLELEKDVRHCSAISETNVLAGAKIICGQSDSEVETILHIFPHTGFSPEHLAQAMREHPEIDTLLASISRVPDQHPLIDKAKEFGLNVIVGNSHSLEIYENGLPLAIALHKLLPQVEVVMFRERCTSTPLRQFGSTAIQNYADMIVEKYLINK